MEPKKFIRSFNNIVGYVYDEPLDVESAWELIKLERRLRSQEGGYKVGDHWYHSDQPSKLQQIGLVMLGANIPANLMWKTMSGDFAPMTQTLAQQIFVAGSNMESQIFQIAEQKRQQTLTADLSTFDFFSGWPQAYWETL